MKVNTAREMWAPAWAPQEQVKAVNLLYTMVIDDALKVAVEQMNVTINIGDKEMGDPARRTSQDSSNRCQPAPAHPVPQSASSVPVEPP